MADFRQRLSEYTGAPYVVLTDCCTHAIELCFRFKNIKATAFPAHTYLSVPMTMHKIGVSYTLTDESWTGQYRFSGTDIYDSALTLTKDMYIPGSMQCLSFGWDKPLALGRGGAILLDDEHAYETIRQMAYDGRKIEISPWEDQKVFKVGYHYNMILETQSLGLQLLTHHQGKIVSKKYPDLRKIKIVGNTQ